MENHELQSQKGKNKYNMFEWLIKKLPFEKNDFTENLAKTLIGYGKKVNFLIRLLDRIEF